MSDDPLLRPADAMAKVTVDEVAALLDVLGVQRRRQQLPQVTPRTPLPGAEGSSNVASEAEWV
ncbi:hypothetical protein [Streptomyces hirsutus]|uniref:hypothetical protein n=1 Tax=Streptomyces hirsutus TaxID=35620 RepID=UPI0006E32C5E|nr:hypothetical protein [Streptomyces hirsutus]